MGLRIARDLLATLPVSEVYVEGNLDGNRKLGVTYAVLVGAGMVVVQYLFVRWWLKSHSRGPLEGLWRKLTWNGAEK